MNLKEILVKVKDAALVDEINNAVTELKKQVEKSKDLEISDVKTSLAKTETKYSELVENTKKSNVNTIAKQLVVDEKRQKILTSLTDVSKLTTAEEINKAFAKTIADYPEALGETQIPNFKPNTKISNDQWRERDIKPSSADEKKMTDKVNLAFSESK